MTIREVLIANGALVFDQSGELTFAGLTPAESQFFVSYMRQPSGIRGKSGELVYLHLKCRHLRARMHFACEALDGAHSVIGNNDCTEN